MRTLFLPDGGFHMPPHTHCLESKHPFIFLLASSSFFLSSHCSGEQSDFLRPGKLVCQRTDASNAHLFIYWFVSVQCSENVNYYRPDLVILKSWKVLPWFGGSRIRAHQSDKYCYFYISNVLYAFSAGRLLSIKVEHPSFSLIPNLCLPLPRSCTHTFSPGPSGLTKVLAQLLNQA